jgi:hypothetical protein
MDSPSPHKRTGGAIAVLLVALLPILYVLSLGPAVMLAEMTESDELVAVFEVVYYPLRWLHENTPLREPHQAYVELWID